MITLRPCLMGYVGLAELIFILDGSFGTITQEASANGRSTSAPNHSIQRFLSTHLSHAHNERAIHAHTTTRLTAMM